MLRSDDVMRTCGCLGMPMDVYRAGDHVLATLDLPGVDPGSIEVSVCDTTVTITAQRQGLPEHDEAVEWLVVERPRGRLHRRLILSRDLDLERMHASYDDGVLSLAIPITDEARPRRVPVEQPGGPAPSDTAAGATTSGDADANAIPVSAVLGGAERGDAAAGGTAAADRDELVAAAS